MDRYLANLYCSFSLKQVQKAENQIDLDIGVGRRYFATPDIASTSNHNPSFLRLTQCFRVLFQIYFDLRGLGAPRLFRADFAIECLRKLRHSVARCILFQALRSPSGNPKARGFEFTINKPLFPGVNRAQSKCHEHSLLSHPSPRWHYLMLPFNTTRGHCKHP
jgi:hypothetical protein